MKKPIFWMLMLLGAAVLFGLGRCSVRPAAPATPQSSAPAPAAAPEVWSCPMHPQIRLPEFGTCPICGMDLVVLSAVADEGPRQLVMSPDAVRLAGIVTATVERRTVTMPVRMVGKVDYDETAVRTISAWVAGRLDRLYVDYTGVAVRKGDHLVWLYSPELLSAQEELLAALARQQPARGDTSDFLADSNRRAHRMAREKLMLWGLTEQQVSEIEARGEAEDHVMLTSPASGVVIRKELDEGAYVETGTRIYSIADLSRLWVRLDAYEQDLPWLRYGQELTLEAEGLPGVLFRGRIAFLDPTVQEATRTVKVRVNLDNSDGRLKPGMFVRATAEVHLGLGGQVIDQSLAGKWISPMHPEIIKDGPGSCDVCGMALVPVEELGLVTPVSGAEQLPLVVPATAVLATGKRAVVYVEVPDAEWPTYEGREVVLGPRAGADYLIESGLSEGEQVVMHGAFRLDSSMQIRAKPSMMSMPGEREVFRGPETAAFRAELQPLFDGYLRLQQALAADGFEAARDHGRQLQEQVRAVRPVGLADAPRARWQEEQPLLAAALDEVAGSPHLDTLRAAFAKVSARLLELETAFGHREDTPYVEAYCPMALDEKGARWLQLGSEITNPYFGPAMLRCGEVRAIHSAVVAPEPLPEATSPVEQPAKDELPTPPAVEVEDQEAPAAASAELAASLIPLYLQAQEALAGDHRQAAFHALDELHQLVEREHQSGGDVDLTALHASLHGMAAASPAALDLVLLRTVFRGASSDLLEIVGETGQRTGQLLQQVHCPMAFGNAGADWLQKAGPVANPYFGARMLRCGSVTREWPAQ